MAQRIKRYKYKYFFDATSIGGRKAKSEASIATNSLGLVKRNKTYHQYFALFQNILERTPAYGVSAILTGIIVLEPMRIEDDLIYPLTQLIFLDTEIRFLRVLR